MQTATRDLDLAALAPMGDALLAELNQLREYDPLHWSEQSNCWIVSGHAEVIEGFSGTLPLSSAHIPKAQYRVMPLEEMRVRIPNTLRYMPRMITNLDGEEHAHLRKLLVKAFNRKLVESLRPFVRDRVAMLLDHAAEQRELEYHEGIARMLPGTVILRLLGMEPEYLSRLKGWTDGVTLALTSFNPKPEWLDGLEVVVTDMLTMFRDQIEKRRIDPGPDFITQMLNTIEGGDRLTVDEMLATLILIIVAGHDTTANSLTLGVRALSRHPQAWAQWRAQPEKGVEFAVELMRYIAMSTTMPRLASQDFDWRGRKIREGDLVMLMIAGGNRDPKKYQQPEVLDFSRPNDMALTFGPGLHHCIGHLLAKLQLSEFFTALTQRFDRVEMLDEPQFTPNLVFRAVNQLHVRFHPAHSTPVTGEGQR